VPTQPVFYRRHHDWFSIYDAFSYTFMKKNITN